MTLKKGEGEPARDTFCLKSLPLQYYVINKQKKLFQLTFTLNIFELIIRNLGQKFQLPFSFPGTTWRAV